MTIWYINRNDELKHKDYGDVAHLEAFNHEMDETYGEGQWFDNEDDAVEAHCELIEYLYPVNGDAL